MKNHLDYFEIIRKIHLDPQVSQRKLAKDLKLSLGKLNYCIKELRNKGLVKIKNFKSKKEKIKYLRKYIITKKGAKYRLDLTLKFMKRKMKE